MSLVTYPEVDCLTAADEQQWREKGFVVIPRERWLGGDSDGSELPELAEQVAVQADADVFNTYEQVAGGTTLSRTENFADVVDDASLFLRHGALPAVAHALAKVDGDDGGVALYKEKINYKAQGGGGGYRPHQDGYLTFHKDAPPYSFVTYVCMVAVDDFTEANGRPQLGWRCWQRKGGLLGSRAADGTNSLYPDMGPYEALDMRRGDVLVYDNYMPHRSAPNGTTGGPRRALFAIYNKRSQGEWRERYYAHEAANRRAGGSAGIGGKANIFFTGEVARAPSAGGGDGGGGGGERPAAKRSRVDLLQPQPQSPPPAPSASIADKEATLREIVRLFDDASQYGRVSQMQHALQAAKQAEDAGADDATVVAALLHDIGWKLAKAAPWRARADDPLDEAEEAPVAAPDAAPSLAEELGILRLCGIVPGASTEQQQAQHDVVGATYLRMRGFSEKVAHVVEGHVLAKRYLCHAEPDYHAKLSRGSVFTLGFQGGPMSADEARRFRADPLFETCVSMRRWDEGAKRPEWSVPPLAHYVRRLREQLAHKPTDDVAALLARTSFVRDGNVIVAVRSCL